MRSCQNRADRRACRFRRTGPRTAIDPGAPTCQPSGAGSAAATPGTGARGRARLKLPEPRRPSQTPRPRPSGCPASGSQDGAAPHAGAMPTDSGSTLIPRPSEPRAIRQGPGRITTRRCRSRQFQAIQAGIGRPPMHQSGFPEARGRPEAV